MKNRNSRTRLRAVLAAAALVLTPLSMPMALVGSPANAEGENIAPPPAPAPLKTHNVYVADITNVGEAPDADAVDVVVDKALARWSTETDGRLAFKRMNKVATYATATDCADFDAVVAEAEKQFPDVKSWDPSSLNHLIVFASPTCRDSSKAYQPSGGSIERGGEVVISYDYQKGTQSLFHEMGHNFGLYHASADQCADGCTEDYGDRYAVMGKTIKSDVPFTHASLDSFERTRLALTLEGEVKDLSLETDRRVHSYEFDVRGRGTDAGVRGLAITDPRTKARYWVDFRSGAGRDKDSWYGRNADPKNSSGFVYNRGVTVQRVIDDKKTSLRLFAGSDGVNRYAMRAGDAFDTDVAGDGKNVGMRIEVKEMAVTGSVNDVAHIKVVLTNEEKSLFQQTGALSISGRGGVGDTMTATPSGWTPGSTLGDVTWYDNGIALPGAVGSSYVIGEELQGHRLSARVTGKQESYQDLTATSNEVVVGQGLQRSLVEGATYEIRSVDTGKLLSDPGYKTGSLTQLAALAAPVGGSTGSQRWTVNSVGADGSFRLQNQGSTTGCLDNAAGSSSDGSKTIEWSCHTGVNQRWTIVGNGYGYTLVNQGTKKSVAPATGDEGSLVAQVSTSYAWKFVRVG